MGCWFWMQMHVLELATAYKLSNMQPFLLLNLDVDGIFLYKEQFEFLWVYSKRHLYDGTGFWGTLQMWKSRVDPSGRANKLGIGFWFWSRLCAAIRIDNQLYWYWRVSAVCGICWWTNYCEWSGWPRCMLHISIVTLDSRGFTRFVWVPWCLRENRR